MKSKTYLSSILLAFLLGLPLLSCKEDKAMAFLLPGSEKLPAVLEAYPRDGMRGTDPNEPPWVLFNMEMDRQKTQSAFSLTSESGKIVGEFSWEETKLFFYPQSPIDGPGEHVLVVSRSAESEVGVDLGEDYIVRFYPNSDNVRPAFISSRPANGDVNVAPATDIRLTFSEPLDYTTLNDSVSVSPSFQNVLSLSADRRVIIITPSQELSNGNYTVNVSNALKDDAGNSPLNDVSISFTAGSDFASPAVLSASQGALNLIEGQVVANAEKTGSLTVRFSESMDPGKTESSVVLSPATLTSMSWNAAGDELTVTFLSPLESETNYTLRVDQNARDISNNILDRTYTFPFYTNGPLSIRPAPLRIRQHAVDFPGGGTDGAQALSSTFLSPDLTDYAPLDISHVMDVDPSVLITPVIKLRIDFNNSITNTSFASSVSISTLVSPDIAGSVSIYDAAATGTAGYVYLLLAPAPSSTGTPLYKITIRGGEAGITDLNGNTMANDFDLIIAF